MREIEELTLNKIAKLSEKHITELKNKPRTGKEVRINKYNLQLPVQSLYDHIISFSRNADLLSEWLGLSLDVDEKGKLSSYIAYHDLAELIIGDVPDFTTEDFSKHSKQGHVSKEEKLNEEKKANAELIKTIPEHIKENFQEMIDLENDINTGNNTTAKFALMCDRSEPIITIWRYIEMFRDEIDIGNFMAAMSDFFENPKPLKCSYNESTSTLVKTLQNKENTKRFHKEGEKYLETLEELPTKLLHKLIVTPNMHFID